MQEYDRLFNLVFGRKSTSTDWAGALAYIPLDQLERLAAVPEMWTEFRKHYAAWKKKYVQACMTELAK